MVRGSRAKPILGCRFLPFALCYVCTVTDSTSRRGGGAIAYLCSAHEQDVHMLTHSLQLLQQNMLARFERPVIIFHDGLSDVQQLKIRSAGPAAISFESINLRVLPSCLSEDRLRQLIGNQTVVERASHVRHVRDKKDIGYRYMIRWVAGGMAAHPALDPYEYVMRLDSDSFLINPMAVDPFEAMADGG